MANAANVSMGKTYLRRLFDALAPRNYTFEQMLQGLRLNSYNEAITEEDFQDWLDSLGFIYKEAQSSIWSDVSQDLIQKLKSSFKGNANWIPTRKTIDSFFINSTFSPSYFDIAKVAMMSTTSLVTSSGDVVGSVGNLLKETSQVMANTMKGLKYVAYIGGPILIAYIIYQNRDSIASKTASVSGKLVDGVGAKMKRFRA